MKRGLNTKLLSVIVQHKIQKYAKHFNQYHVEEQRQSLNDFLKKGALKF